jgi:nucleoid-associated protein YgaU
MTRENKLALVVGFGLILFIGILISDHFSVARNQSSAMLTNRRIDDPLVMQSRNDPDLIAIKPEPPAPARLEQGEPAMNTSRMATGNGTIEPMSPEQRSMVDRSFAMAPGAGSQGISRHVQPTNDDAARRQNGTTAQVPDIPGFVPVDGTAEVNIKNIRFHDVRSGESLYAICKQYYGDTALVVPLAKFNKMDDPAALREGRRLMIPPAEAIGGKPKPAPASQPATNAPKPTAVASNPANAKPAQPAAPSAPQPARTYTVKPGDSLASIAKRYLGSESRWRDLHKLNKSVIDDPDNIRAGTVLNLG